jgi:cytochrome P450
MTSNHSHSAQAHCPHSYLAEEFNPWDGAYVDDPYPFFARARRQHPVFYSPEVDMWVISRYDDISAVLRDPRRFSAANATAPVSQMTPEARQILIDGGYTLKPALTNNDPPAHTRVRSHINKVFSARRVAQMEPRIRQYADALLDAFVGDGQADLVRQFAYRLPILVVLHLIGIPDSDMDRIKAWCGNRMLFMFGRPSPEQQINVAQDLVAFWNYTKAFCEQRQREPQDDLTSDLAAIATADPSALDIDELASIIFSLSIAGHETTTSLLGNAMKHLLTHREQWEQLCANPALIENAVEELLRFDGPLPIWRRVAKEDIELSGVKIPQGAKLALVLGSGSHDEACFAHPEQLDIHRQNARTHLAFGKGIHYCIGAPLARLEAEIALERFAQRLPGLRLVPDQQIEYAPMLTVRGPKQLLVAWDTAPRAAV